MILGELTKFKSCALRLCLIRSYHINNTTSVLRNKEHFGIWTLTLNPKLVICHRMRIYTTCDNFFALHINQRYIPAVISRRATKFAVTLLGQRMFTFGSVSQGSTVKSDTAQIAQCPTFFNDPLLASCKTSAWTTNQPDFKALQFQKHNVSVRHWFKLEILRRNLWWGLPQSWLYMEGNM
jgi:hypothetical protein